MKSLELVMARQQRFVRLPALGDIHDYDHHKGFKEVRPGLVGHREKSFLSARRRRGDHEFMADSLAPKGQLQATAHLTII
jgi:hypothetical protein